MSLENVIEIYGYWALFVGTVLEGETFVVIAGFLAHQGYLQLKFVMLISFLGSLLGDQFYFYIGRRKGRSFLEKKPSWKKKTDKIQLLIEKHQNFLMLSFRFLYGFRTVTPFVIGMSNIKTGKFAILNTFSALMWAILVSTGGFMFGRTLALILDEVKHYEIETVSAIVVAGMIIWLIYFYRNKCSTD